MKRLVLASVLLLVDDERDGVYDDKFKCGDCTLTIEEEVQWALEHSDYGSPGPLTVLSKVSILPIPNADYVSYEEALAKLDLTQ